MVRNAIVCAIALLANVGAMPCIARPEHGTVFNLHRNSCAPLVAAKPKQKEGEKSDSPFTSGFETDPSEDLNEKVSSLYSSGKYEEALPLARQAVQLSEKSYGTEGQEVAKPLNNLAWLLQATGDYSGARPLFERSLSINEKALGPDDPEVATSLNNLAALLSYQGDTVSARPLYERALVIQEKALGPTDPVVGDSLNNLAVLLESSGHPEAALPLYERALAITEKSLGPEHPDLATSLNNLGSMHESMGDLAAAGAMFERALKIREKALPADHPDLAESLNNLALLRSAQGDTTQAKELLGRGLAIYEHSLGPDHPDVASALNNLGKLDWKLGNNQEAGKSFLKAARIINHHVVSVLPSLSFAEQRAFLQSKIPEEISLLLSTCREGKLLTDAYDFVFRWKGLLIESLRWQKAVLTLGENPEYKSKVEQLQNLRSQLAAWYHEAGSVPYGEWKKKNDALTAGKEGLERELARALKPGSLRDILADLTLADFCGLLKDGEALIDIYRYQEIGAASSAQKYAAVISSKNGPVAMADFGSAKEVDAALNSWRKHVLIKTESNDDWKAVSALVWTRISDVLPAGTQKSFLSPDAQLTRVPWHLVAGRDKKTEQLMVSQLDSMRELANLRLVAHSQLPAHPLFLVAGGIDFGAGDSGMGDQLHMPELPGTLKEAERLKQLAEAQGMTVSLLTGVEANKRKVLGLLPQSSWIHLATHGFFFDEARAAKSSRLTSFVKKKTRRPLRNPLVESGIVLAREENPDATTGSSGRFLTAEEMVGLDLSRAELMTLSACETGLGEAATGQGVLGLRASIMAAGARSILMSLWKVPDESTLLVMQEFYTNLWVKKMTKVEALRQAQHTVKNQPYERFVDPIHWAAWVLVGEGW